jgi:hypothetical protein
MKQAFKDSYAVEIDVHIFVDPTQQFTVVNIFSSKDGEIVEGIGVAKRNLEDEFDFAEGTNLATKRALINLAEQFSEY